MGGCCDPRAPRPKMISVGGRKIGVLGLDEVISEVAEMGPLPEDRLLSELLSRFRRHNYVPDSARDSYTEALAGEYRSSVGESEKYKVKGTMGVMEVKVLGPGCKNCKTLEKMVIKVLEELGADATVVKVEKPKEIAALGVLMTPGLIVNGKIKSTGKVPGEGEIAGWIKEEMDK